MECFSGPFLHGSDDKTFQKNPFKELAVCAVRLQECCSRFLSLTCATSPDALPCGHQGWPIKGELYCNTIMRCPNCIELLTIFMLANCIVLYCKYFDLCRIVLLLYWSFVKNTNSQLWLNEFNILPSV